MGFIPFCALSEAKGMGIKMEWEEFKKKRFSECPELKEEYDKLKLERKIVTQVIDLRKKENNSKTISIFSKH